jgi:hypothetical protein
MATIGGILTLAIVGVWSTMVFFLEKKSIRKYQKQLNLKKILKFS